jgi:hypothetical protein
VAVAFLENPLPYRPLFRRSGEGHVNRYLLVRALPFGEADRGDAERAIGLERVGSAVADRPQRYTSRRCPILKTSTTRRASSIA